MVKGCLANELNYLDVTGEIDVFEVAQNEYNQPAKDKGATDVFVITASLMLCSVYLGSWGVSAECFTCDTS